MEDIAKRLIAANFMGIWIEKADGHRWIRSTEAYGYFDFDLELSKAGVSVNNKIYGGLEEALDVIDLALDKCNYKSLIEWYNEMVDEEWDIYTRSEVGSVESRVDIVDGNRGGLN